MRIPGFAGEVSLYRSRRQYRTARNVDAVTGGWGISPQLRISAFPGSVVSAKCESDDGSTCDCPGKCCSAGPDYCACGPCEGSVGGFKSLFVP